MDDETLIDENLIDDDSSSEDDECTFSLTKRLFMFTANPLHQCKTCKYLITSQNQTLVLFVNPTGDCTIKNLLAKGIISSLTKECMAVANQRLHMMKLLQLNTLLNYCYCH